MTMSVSILFLSCVMDISLDVLLQILLSIVAGFPSAVYLTS